LTATDAIVHTVPFLKPADPVYRALDLMADCHLTALPVVNNSKLEGLVTEEILMNMNDQLLLSGIEKIHPDAYVSGDDHVLDVIKIMEEFRLGILPVIDASDNYLGAITPQSILSILSRKSWVSASGGILVLEVRMASFSLSELARIVESSNATIIYADTTLITETEMVEVTIKINKSDLKDIIQSLERFNYEIKATYHTSTHDDSLKDHYDSLMMYLNV
jgi:predicted transcriptional regulator